MKTVVLLEYKIMVLILCVKPWCYLVINFKNRRGSPGLYTNVALALEHLRLDVLTETIIIRQESNMGPLA